MPFGAKFSEVWTLQVSKGMGVDSEGGSRECLRFKLCVCACMEYVCVSITVILINSLI